MEDLEDMLGFKPYWFYYYMWRYVSPAVLAALIISTMVQMAISPSGYSAWVASEVRVQKCLAFSRCTPLRPCFLPPALFVFQGMERFQSYPTWASAMAYFLIVVALLPLPVIFIARRFNLSVSCQARTSSVSS